MINQWKNTFKLTELPKVKNIFSVYMKYMIHVTFRILRILKYSESRKTTTEPTAASPMLKDPDYQT